MTETTPELSDAEERAIALAKVVIFNNASMQSRVRIFDACLAALKAAYDDGRRDGENYARP